MRIPLGRTPGRLARWASNLSASALGLIFMLAVLEVGLRLVTMSSDPRVLVYPRVATDINGFKDPAFEKKIPPGEFRILALGASAFVTRSFQPEFQRLLNESPFFGGRRLRVRIVSTGVPAHMTYDSLWKYRYWYAGYDFDVVMYYHGINDARANNYPRSVFREDYTQFPYFRQYAPIFAWIDRHPVLSRSFCVSFVAKLVGKAWIRFSPAFQRDAPYNDPRQDPWLPEGADVKSAAVFERNAEELIALARSRGQRVLLLTYAYYLPSDYTNERFLARQTDYSFMEESVATEVWGRKENVVKAIETHNAVTRKIAARHPDVLFFDMDRFMPKDKAHFIDICHWTDLGRATFARGVEGALRGREKTVFARRREGWNP
jgi:hypothetical protein